MITNVNQPRIELSTTDKDVIDRFAEIIGVGKIRVRWKEKSTKLAYEWYVQDRDGVIEVIKKLGPLLHDRRSAQMLKVLERAVEMRPYRTRSKKAYDLTK